MSDLVPQPFRHRPAAQRWTPNDGMTQAMSALSYLLGGLLVYGGLGLAGAHFLHLAFLLPVGIVIGAGLGTLLIVRRYGPPGQEATEDWVEQRNAQREEWARLAGRPESLRRSEPNRPTKGSPKPGLSDAGPGERPA